MSKFIEVTDNSGCNILLNTAYIYEVLPEDPTTGFTTIMLTVKGDDGRLLYVYTDISYKDLCRMLTDE